MTKSTDTTINAMVPGLRWINLHVITFVALSALLLAGCSASNSSRQPPGRSQPTASAPTKLSPQPTRERFTVDVVTGDKSQMKPASLPQSGSYFGQQSTYSGATELTTMFVVGNYIVQAKPPLRKPIRITLHGITEYSASGPLTWNIDNSSIANLSASGKEAFLDFKEDGRVKIVVQSGDKVVFRFGANAKTGENKEGKLWQVTIARENEEGKTIDMYGEVSNK